MGECGRVVLVHLIHYLRILFIFSFTSSISRHINIVSTNAAAKTAANVMFFVSIPTPSPTKSTVIAAMRIYPPILLLHYNDLGIVSKIFVTIDECYQIC